LIVYQDKWRNLTFKDKSFVPYPAASSVNATSSHVVPAPALALVNATLQSVTNAPQNQLQIQTLTNQPSQSDDDAKIYPKYNPFLIFLCYFAN